MTDYREQALMNRVTVNSVIPYPPWSGGGGDGPSDFSVVTSEDERPWDDVTIPTTGKVHRMIAYSTDTLWRRDETAPNTILPIHSGTNKVNIAQVSCTQLQLNGYTISRIAQISNAFPLAKCDDWTIFTAKRAMKEWTTAILGELTKKFTWYTNAKILTLNLSQYEIFSAKGLIASDTLQLGDQTVTKIVDSVDSELVSERVGAESIDLHKSLLTANATKNMTDAIIGEWFTYHESMFKDVPDVLLVGGSKDVLHFRSPILSTLNLEVGSVKPIHNIVFADEADANDDTLSSTKHTQKLIKDAIDQYASQGADISQYWLTDVDREPDCLMLNPTYTYVHAMGIHTWNVDLDGKNITDLDRIAANDTHIPTTQYVQKMINDAYKGSRLAPGSVIEVCPWCTGGNPTFDPNLTYMYAWLPSPDSDPEHAPNGWYYKLLGIETEWTERTIDLKTPGSLNNTYAVVKSRFRENDQFPWEAWSLQFSISIHDAVEGEEIILPIHELLGVEQYILLTHYICTIVGQHAEMPDIESVKAVFKSDCGVGPVIHGESTDKGMLHSVWYGWGMPDGNQSRIAIVHDPRKVDAYTQNYLMATLLTRTEEVFRVSISVGTRFRDRIWGDYKAMQTCSSVRYAVAPKPDDPTFDGLIDGDTSGLIQAPQEMLGASGNISNRDRE